ncbi:protein YIPF5, putative [Entamoeba invadens IP1]|uniref:Protein YIPF5, putative n=1 Tax=Entamoeba invadens IP1 TaxID=370355 RepID=A0A0A1UGL8_ENTIV|nr:protein YIPF5, putative [Entamoeba invadens IP1]ELP94994.1 protein YIPF5, putative [Entamoeba invadens IP1]|eukprot:XP_004261765.1 protein YIPF5, putative [Entamoeba invadens IP1]
MEFGDDQDFVTFEMGNFEGQELNLDTPDVVYPINIPAPVVPVGFQKVASPIPPPTKITNLEKSESPNPQVKDIHNSTPTPVIASPIPNNIRGFENVEDKPFENEPPLLEELGIDFKVIGKRIVTKLNPLTKNDDYESDVIGSLFFGLLLGVAILLTGKFRFGYVFGFTFVGSFAEYFVLSLLSVKKLDFSVVLTNLGYSSYPLVVLAVASVFVSNKTILSIIAISGIAWCTLSSSRFFANIQEITDKKLLVAYPMALYFILFVLLVMF